MSDSLDPIAEAMFRGRAFAETIGELHRKTFGQLPMTPMARAHAMRSAVQAQAIDGLIEGFSLIDNHLWAGRVEVVRDRTKRHYLLKARSALPFESYQGTLFDETNYEPGTAPLLLLLYQFSLGNLTMATAPTQRVKENGRVRYHLLGKLSDAGTWSAAHVPDLEPFDQGTGDDFGDLSEDVRLLGEEARDDE